ncbi:MAG: hypothetical protein DRP94_02445 [Candidatus Latescibacterota bacterium]|nr:MAG: hypothetical protein DRP94_02445 [Candidatus Latescibacterota bacterium]RKY73182.1 MAG: hypothetical protein DRQ14_04740 [Candidatus Latescibacterota bacterium]HDI00665.1 AarF/ABC1/UbiB kinase family protein [Bacillota bacterium]
MLLKGRYRHLKRYRQIAGVLFKYGFSEIADRLGLPSRLGLGRRQRRAQVRKVSYPVRFRMALEELGPTFIKLGQVLSMRSFLIPPELASELSKLQDEVAPAPFEEIRRVVEGELGGPISSFFSDFSEEPVGSASLAQAHPAVTRDGEEVVVKVQRPGVEEIVKVDLEILMDIAKLAERYIPESRQYDPTGVVRELAKTTRRELNFKNEARNVEIFSRNFSDFDGMYILRVYWDLSSAKVLTLERIKGIKISDLDAIRASGIDPKDLAVTGARAVLKQMFEDGFFHADPHPGNLFVLEGGVIAPVDFGMVGRLDEKMKEELADVAFYAVQKDVDGIVHTLIRLGVLPEDADVRSFGADVADLVDRYYGLPLGRVDVREALQEGYELMHRYRLRVQPSWMLLGRALGTYEEVGRMLYPDLDLLSMARPYIRRLVRERFGMKRGLRELVAVADDLRKLARALPYELERTLGKAARGELGVELRHRGLERFMDELDKASNRLAFALVVAALIVGSALVLQLDRGPFLFGYPAFGVLGFLFAGILGIWLAIAILRSGRM